MDNLQILKRIEREAQRVLYYAYKTSETFPRSCGVVSGLLARIIYRQNLLPEYDVYYIRGLHLKQYEIPDECSFCRGAEKIPCSSCEGCCGVDEHSWIEVVDKQTNERIILDFTSIQFDEEVILYEECFYDNDFTVKELYDFIWENSYFTVNEEDENFKDYIPCYKQVLNGEAVDNSVRIMNDWLHFILREESA